MEKKNKTVPIFFTIPVFTIFLFFWIVDIHVFTQTNIFKFSKKIQLGELIERSEASEAKIDKNDIDVIINAKVKYIEFSDSKKYDHERDIVYKITNMAESEKYSEGSMKKAVIRIALEDLNNDGIKEILAYIIQFEYCGRGGGYCTFLVLQRNKSGKWQRIFITAAYEGDIGILNAKHYGYYNIAVRLSDLQDCEVIAKWDGKLYKFTTRRQIIYDSETNKEKVTIWNWDNNTSSWEIIKEFNRLKPGHKSK